MLKLGDASVRAGVVTTDDVVRVQQEQEAAEIAARKKRNIAERSAQLRQEAEARRRSATSNHK